jgi:bacterioferritin-associated ferredoxin
MQQVLPGKRFLLAGTGPLQLVLANQIINAGGKVVAILEAGSIGNLTKAIRGVWGNWSLLADGWRYWRGIKKAKVPLLCNTIPIKACGNGQIEKAVICKCDKDWRPIISFSHTIEVDTISLGYGFIPSVELTRLAECKHIYDSRLGGWVPVRGENMETSVSFVYAVGDCSGVAGSLVASLEGRVAGIAAAHALGYISSKEAKKRQKPFFQKIRKLNRFRRYMDDISTPRPGIYELGNNETIVCRCEEVTLGDIKKAILEGITNINELKRLTRAGMGLCQGRMCGNVIQEIQAAMLGLKPHEIGFLTPRPPIKPVSLEIFENFDSS